MERRRFLTSGLGASIAAVGGAGALSAVRYHGTRRWLHSAGLLEGPHGAAPDVDGAVVIEHQIDSAAMRQTVAYATAVPVGAVSCVLFCLHGRGGNRRDAFDHFGVHRFVKDAGLPWGVASIDGGDTFWRKRSDGTDAQSMLIDELVPAVLAQAPGARPVVLGWSMGGYGALLAAVQRPGAFQVVVANGPSIWYSAAASPAGAFDGETDYQANDVLGSATALAGQAVLAEAGADDYFADVVRDLQRRSPTVQIGVHRGFHDDATWRSFLPNQLAFIRQSLGH
jgi:pimeloyl-ACP methyl ester carboxylesterase